MSQSISGQVTDGILNAFGIIVGGGFAVALLITFWWVVIPLVIFGGCCYGLYRLTRKRPLSVIWGVFILVIGAIWWQFDNAALFAIMVAGGSAAVAITVAVLHYKNSKSSRYCGTCGVPSTFSPCAVCQRRRR